MKKLMFLLIILVLLVGCAKETTLPPVPAPTKAPTQTPHVIIEKQSLSSYQKNLPFRFIFTNQEHPVVLIMQAGFIKACEDFELECELMGVSGNDIEASVRLAEQSVTLGSSGILATIYDPAWYQATQVAIDNGIPVVNGHFPMESDVLPGLLGWVSADTVDYAVNVAHAMAEKLDCEGKVAVTQGSLNDIETPVAESFIATLNELCPDMEVLEPQMEGFDIPEAIAVASAILQANPEVNGAFSTTGNGPTTWAKAAEDLGYEPGEITIISMDYSTENLDLVKNGEVYMLVGQPLFEEMYAGVVLLLQAVMGNPVPYENMLPAPLITVENIEPYYAINELADSIALP